MIIFNLYAILVAIICFIVYLPIFMVVRFLFPDVSEEMIGLIFMGTATIVSGICEACGAPGRLFFLPMWLIGGFLTFFMAIAAFGWSGVGILFVVGIGMMGMLYVVARKMEQGEWASAPVALLNCQQVGDPSSKEFWEHFKKAFFAPDVLSLTPEMAKHNVRCLDLLRATAIEWPEIPDLRSAFDARANAGSEEDPDSEQVEAFKGKVTERLEAFA